MQHLFIQAFGIERRVAVGGVVHPVEKQRGVDLHLILLWMGCSGSVFGDIRGDGVGVGRRGVAFDLDLNFGRQTGSDTQHGKPRGGQDHGSTDQNTDGHRHFQREIAVLGMDFQMADIAGPDHLIDVINDL